MFILKSNSTRIIHFFYLFSIQKPKSLNLTLQYNKSRSTHDHFYIYFKELILQMLHTKLLGMSLSGSGEEDHFKVSHHIWELRPSC